MDALTLLHERHSCHALDAPGPNAEQLQAILRAGMAVPDFQHLHPYEFLVAEGQGRERLGKHISEAAAAAGLPQAVVDRAMRMPLRAPMVIVVVSKYRHSETVSALEQQLSAGSAVLAMQMAAVAQGLGGIWRSGWPMFSRPLHDALGLAEEDQIVGFLYLGTEKPGQDIPVRTDPSAFCRML